jgi:hypothetical protein
MADAAAATGGGGQGSAPGSVAGAKRKHSAAWSSSSLDMHASKKAAAGATTVVTGCTACMDDTKVLVRMLIYCYSFPFLFMSLLSIYYFLPAFSDTT